MNRRSFAVGTAAAMPAALAALAIAQTQKPVSTTRPGSGSPARGHLVINQRACDPLPDAHKAAAQMACVEV